MQQVLQQGSANCSEKFKNEADGSNGCQLSVKILVAAEAETTLGGTSSNAESFSTIKVVFKVTKTVVQSNVVQ